MMYWHLQQTMTSRCCFIPSYQSITSTTSHRLIAALQSCFSDLLQRQDDLLHKQDDIQKAVESLKPPPVTDTKMKFWNSYMKLADEHDKELKEKYSTDLDTSLIFSGLFSAVASAFIIQIQPQLAAPTTVVVVSQALLYISLIIALLAALLAFLGKQWIMQYQAAGSRGTIEQRGLERQRKLDGLKKWKFDTVLQMFPLLLQLALLLFSAALSAYLWTVHLSIALIVLVLISLGFMAYLFLLGTAVLFHDSPFQTPLSKAVSPKIRRGLLTLQRKIRTNVGRWTAWIYMFFYHLSCFIAHKTDVDSLEQPWEWGRTFVSIPSVEPSAILWVLELSTDPSVITTAAEMAVWLEWRSGNLEWKWAPDPDLPLAMSRLAETVRSCFQLPDNPMQAFSVREGMAGTATACGIVYSSLRHALHVSGCHEPDQGFMLGTLHMPENCPSDLQTVISILNRYPDVSVNCEEQYIIEWGLNMISCVNPPFHILSVEKRIQYFLDNFPNGYVTKDENAVCNFLCCLNSFFQPVNPLILKQKDKRRFRVFLLTQLFDDFISRKIESSLVTRIFKTTSKMMNQRYETDAGVCTKLAAAIARFCTRVPQGEQGWFDLVLSAAMLAQVSETGKRHPYILYRSSQGFRLGKDHNIQWIFTALEHVTNLQAQYSEWDAHTKAGVEGLLALLAWTRSASVMPSVSTPTLMTIISALSAGKDISFWAFFIIGEGYNWFYDSDTMAIMQQFSVFSRLGQVAIECGEKEVYKCYMELVYNISDMPEWKPIICRELSTWITVFSKADLTDPLWMKFSYVLERAWGTRTNDQHKFSNALEKRWAMACLTLAEGWDGLIPHVSSLFQELVDLIRATVLLAVKGYSHPSCSLSGLMTFLPILGKSMTRASQNILSTTQWTGQANQVSGPDELFEHILVPTQIASLVETLGKHLTTQSVHGAGQIELGGTVKEYRNWDELHNLFLEELNHVELSIRTEHED
ncbi:hypothetical protein B0H14DRAFT_316670 [Mycena olivaceomarginata]|nr:hypothetical protein B0H14DRAFT_316670 [Mycena olivaceomarginata]